jgi:polyhydroxyalkanoate synthesis regulator phasin
MAQNDLLKRYLDAGLAFTQMTQQRAEAIARDLVKTGEVQREQAQSFVEDLLERSRRNTERMVDNVRKEVRSQLASRRVATKADIARLERRIDRLASAGKKSPAKRSSAKRKSGAKKRAAQRSAP